MFLFQDTIVLTSLKSVNNDEAIWGDPKNFRPERFLDDNGKLCLKKDVSLPFAAGKYKDKLGLKDAVIKPLYLFQANVCALVKHLPATCYS